MKFFLLLFAPFTVVAYAQQVEYVVAHYQENLDWLVPYSANLRIYHKGNLDQSPIPAAGWVKLSNVGREGHTYLFHIINNYQNLADITFFLQGKIEDHALGKSVEDLLPKVMAHGVAFFGRRFPARHFCYDYPRFLRFWREIFGTQAPNQIAFYAGACFGVRRELILRHPIDFYEKILRVLAKSRDPDEGYYVERMWCFMFDPVDAISVQN